MTKYSSLYLLTMVIFYIGFSTYLVLGEDFSIFQSSEIPASDQNLMRISENSSPTIYNVTLLITNWDETLHLGGLNVSIYDMDGNLILSGISNSTGHLDLQLEEKSYAIMVESGGRIVGYQHVYVNNAGIMPIKTWSYTLQITCIDKENRYVSGATVLLYEQANILPTNITGSRTSIWSLVNLAKTNINGSVTFNNVWNGTYKIIVESSKIMGEKIVHVTKSERLVIECRKTSLEIKIVASTLRERPLSNATVILQDSAGNIALKSYTDQDGCIRINNVYVDNYTIFIDWMNAEVYSGVINAGTSNSFILKSSVFEVTVRVVDLSNKPLPQSKIFVRKMGVGRYNIYGEIIKELEADENGLASLLLPSGNYEISASSGIYSGKSTVALASGGLGGETAIIRCNIQFSVWVLIFLISLPLSVLSLLLERNKLRKPLEYKRYKNMLMRLESMYSSGLVEYKTYRKLKDEYEAKLMELGGRRGR
ncbi:carboxypeptidase regulatory-like domain-containing protein [Candidatus Bathyarchaeota archaeon]|nr:carboxypeptidase regulatory-like domain-containing protein [Candidatus Bathyarchaeota archaeon]